MAADVVDSIHAGATIEDVSHPVVRLAVRAPAHYVVPWAPGYLVATLAALDLVVAVFPVDLVVTGTAFDPVVALEAEYRVVAALAEDYVLARTASDLVILLCASASATVATPRRGEGRPSGYQERDGREQYQEGSSLHVTPFLRVVLFEMRSLLVDIDGKNHGEAPRTFKQRLALR